MEPTSGSHAAFHTTQWTLLPAAGGDDDVDERFAREPSRERTPEAELGALLRALSA